MAIEWGSVAKHMQVGIDISMSPSTVGPSTTSVTIYVDYYVRAEAWNFEDSQSLDRSGNLSGSTGYFFDNNSSGNAWLIVSDAIAVTPSTGGPTGLSFSASVSGIYAGAGGGSNPGHTRYWTVPTKPTVPGAPTAFAVSAITGTTASTGWVAPAVTGGLTITNYLVKVSTDIGFTSPVDFPVGSAALTKALTGLAPGTPLWARVYAYNAAGWSGPSNTVAFTTLAVPSPPQALLALLIGNDSITVGYSESASNGGSPITSHEVHISTNPSFSPYTPVADTDFLHVFAGLTPNTAYSFRARSGNSVGWSSPSATLTVTTLSASWIKVGGVWKRVLRTYVKVGGTWKQVRRTKIKKSGAWV